MNRKLLIPLAVFVVLAASCSSGLWRDPREVPSPLIGKPAPAFTLAQLHEPGEDARHRRHEGQGLAAQRLGVVVRVLPRGASAAGRSSAKAKIVPIIGLDYKDEPAAGKRWLAQQRRSVHGVGRSIATAASASTTASTACPRRS